MKNRRRQKSDKLSTGTYALVEKIRRNYKSFLLGVISLVLIISIGAQFLSQSKNQTDSKEPTPTSATEQPDQSKPDSFKGTVYVVQEGDNLWSIAEKYLGSGFRFEELVKTNGIKNPKIIEIGQQLTIPKSLVENDSQGEITKTAASTQKGQTGETTYTVKQGDYLWKIAQEVYGDGFQWTKIATTNNLQSPNVIHTGNVLRIPPKESS